MARKTKISYATYNLGLEELALSLGLISRPNLGRSLILDIYQDLTAEQIEERLTSASHSLLARGLCGLNESGQPVIEGGLELAVFPLAKFDKLIQVNITNPQSQANARIHVITGKYFTSHMVSIGVVHTLEHGAYKHLQRYTAELFAEFAKAIGMRKQDKFQHPIRLGLLGRLLELGDNEVEIERQLIADGWAPDWAANLARDLAKQEVRATILAIEGNSEMEADQAQSAPQRTLLLLQGVDRCWAFAFPGTGDDAKGTVQVLDRGTFEKLLKQVVG